VTERRAAEAAARDAAIGAAVRTVRERIGVAAARVRRDPADITLIAVTKTHPTEDVLAAARAGVRDLGENRALDLVAKASALAPALAGEVRPRWHFLGPLQSGTVRHVADAADVVQSAEPGTAIERLARRCAAAGRVMDVLIEVDLTGVRHGVAPAGLFGFADRLAMMPGVRLIGLMTIAPVSEDAEGARPCFAQVRTLSERLRTDHPGAEELSMGMSFDYEVGVEEGATMVRVGTALFGPRQRHG
jgi:pyridoxal phosphate enzyme (YggS family)